MKASDVNDIVIALFESQADAEQAIQDLKYAGFPQDSIGVVLRDPAYGRGRVSPANLLPLPAETVTEGALGSGILGGVVGLLTGVGAIALPGAGPVIAGGVLVPALTGAGFGAAAGGVLGALVGLGIPDSAARYFEDGVREGSVLVMVEAGARRGAARDILRFSRGDLGGEAAEDEAWRGNERRYRDDPEFGGPDRRFGED